MQINVARTEASTPKPGLHVNFKTTVKRTYKIRDAKTGEMKEYHSLDEVPPDIRALIEQTQRNPDAR